MGHSLPQALTAWGKFVIDVESATKFFLRELYSFQAPPEKPITYRDEKAARNDEIRQRYENGESIPNLAIEYGLSNARIHQILHKRRK